VDQRLQGGENADERERGKEEPEKFMSFQESTGNPTGSNDNANIELPQTLINNQLLEGELMMSHFKVTDIANIIGNKAEKV